MSDNIFLLDAEQYQRNLSPIQQYIEQTSFYLHKNTGKPLEDCKTFIKNELKNKENNVRDPIVRHYVRNEYKDKYIHECTLSNYIKDSINNDEVLVPTFTSYLSSKEEPSFLVSFTDNNKKLRSIAKKEAFKAKSEGNMDLFIMKNNEQNNKKLYNNSMSGAFATKGSVLYNPSAHSTLTSTIRIASSVSNSSNEKIIAGNRHYYNPSVTLYNIISITNSVDRDKLKSIISKYNLVYPTKEDVINCIRYSSDLYWKDENAFKTIDDFVSSLDEVERAAFVYISDLYHIRKHNEGFIRQLLAELSLKVKNVVVEDPITILRSIDEQIINVAHHICLSEMKGIGRDYEKLSEEDLNTVAATSLNIQKVVLGYKDFIECFFLTSNVPANTAYISNMVRRTVVLSDTDSTMFSVDDWVRWYFGDVVFTDEGWSIAISVMYIATQCIGHSLAIFSANMNVARDKLFDLQMKPELSMSVMSITPVAKHYFTLVVAKEGNIYPEPEIDIKGVHLKNSALPSHIVEDSRNKMIEISNTIVSGNKIKLKQLITDTINKEIHIMESVNKGETEFFKRSKIKNQEAYVREDKLSPYLHHLFWLEVFESKYGSTDIPPYGVIKIPTILNNKTALKSWVSSIEDKELALRLGSWILKYNKVALNTLYISETFVKSYGIPIEIKPIINIKKIILDLTITDRLLLQTLGYFPKHETILLDQ